MKYYSLLQNGFVLVVHTVFFGQLIFGKIIIIVATRGKILRLKCTKFYFDWGSSPDPAEGAYSAPPDLLAGFKGPTSTGRGREGMEEEGNGWKRRGRMVLDRRGGTGGEGRGKEKRGEGAGEEGFPESPPLKILDLPLICHINFHLTTSRA